MKKLILVLFLLIEVCTINSNINLEKRDREKEKEKEVDFTKVSEFIKSHEGFRSTPYKCIGGHYTIGYGFVIKYMRTKHSILTIEQADSILNQKLNRIYLIAEREYPELNTNQKLAITHLIYSKGLGSLKSNPLHKQIINNNVKDSTWIYFGKYERLYLKYRDNRAFELKLYYGTNIQ